MSVGMLTGRPAEEMPGSTGDLLPGLLQLHERVRQVMSGVAQALWPSISLPEGLGEDAREAWAMVKMRYTKADPNHLAEVGPVGPNGKEIHVVLVYGQAELVAKYSQ